MTVKSVHLHLQYPQDSTDTTLYKLFGPFGGIADVSVVIDYSNGLCKGYGFVYMNHLEDVQMAINQLNGSFINGKALYVTFTSPRN